MNEREYVVVADLTRIRLAKECLRGITTMPEKDRNFIDILLINNEMKLERELNEID